ncbi:MAG: type II secretion system F family protein [Planctomycetota bacterium]|nr:type II secretion system F family protein [Planctomycetota bacterium]
MGLDGFIPGHWLLVPLAVFGFLASLWLFVVVLLNLATARHADAEGRPIRTWVDGREVEIRVPAAPVMGGRGIGGLLSPRRSGEVPKAFIYQGTMLVGLVFVFTLLLSRSLVAAVLVLALIAGLVALVLRIRASRRRAVLEEQCVSCLRLASRSLRAGHPISGVIRVLAERVPAPLGDQFVQVLQRESLGESLGDAVRNVLLRSETMEMRAFGTALLVQMEAGGNLTESIDRLCDTIVERMVLRRRGRALTADARLSAQLLMLVPFIIVLVFSNYSQRYADFIFGDPLGRLLLVGSLMLLIAGMLVVQRFSRIDRQYEEMAT